MAQTNIKSTALEQPVSIARDGFMAWFSQCPLVMAYCGYVCYW